MPLPAPFDRLRLPVIGSPLFIISGPELVIAQCKAGVIGSFPALNARPSGVLDEWLHQITEELAAHNRDNPDRPAAPFAVNQIVHKSNNRLEEDMEVCAAVQRGLLRRQGGQAAHDARHGQERLPVARHRAHP